MPKVVNIIPLIFSGLLLNFHESFTNIINISCMLLVLTVEQIGKVNKRTRKPK